jgi:SAM-dependent methyltransferase
MSKLLPQCTANVAAVGSLADIVPPNRVRSYPESGHRSEPSGRPLKTNSGHGEALMALFERRYLASLRCRTGANMSQPKIDLEAFRNFERTAHDKLAASYHDAFSVVTDRAIEPLLKAAHVGKGTRLLDVATGPGTLAARAAERGARAIGVDIAPAMVELARTLHPHLDFREGSAEDLPFDSSSFDTVISAFGMGHFSRPENVLAEFARVLGPNGRVALSWWDGFGKNRINGIFFEAINELGISAPGALPAGPAVDRFSDPDQFAAILRAAGFEDVGIDYISFSHPLKSVDELWDLALGSFVRVSTVIRAQNAEVQQRIRQRVEEVARQYAVSNGLQIPIAFRIIAGVR